MGTLRPILDTWCVPWLEAEGAAKHARAAGFAGVWLRVAALADVHARGAAAALADALRAEGDEAFGAVAVDGVDEATFRGPGGLAAVRREVDRACAWAAELGAGRVVLRPGRAPRGLREVELREETRGVLGEEVLPAATRYGVTPVFEPTGDPASSVRTVAHALELCAGLAVAVGADAFEAHRAGEKALPERAATTTQGPPSAAAGDALLDAAVAAVLADPTGVPDPALLARVLGRGGAAAPAAGPAPAASSKEATVLPIASLAVADARATSFPERLGATDRLLPGAGVLDLAGWARQVAALTEASLLVVRAPVERLSRREHVMRALAEHRAGLQALIEAARRA